MGIVALVVSVMMGSLFVSDNEEFFDTVKKEKNNGYEWHYVGKTSLDPKAKNLPLQVCDSSGSNCGEPYILWKLKND